MNDKILILSREALRMFSFQHLLWFIFIIHLDLSYLCRGSFSFYSNRHKLPSIFDILLNLIPISQFYLLSLVLEMILALRLISLPLLYHLFLNHSFSQRIDK